MPPPQQDVIDRPWKACAYGDLERLQSFLQSDPACIHRPGEDGYYPLQWASLNNRASIVHFLVEKGVRVNSVDHTGQSALHWAAVTGSIQAADALLRAGATLELQDNKGYTPCHVAAQYGQTLFCYHLAVRWNADVDRVDSDGRT